jgi:hypothetical protein
MDLAEKCWGIKPGGGGGVKNVTEKQQVAQLGLPPSLLTRNYTKEHDTNPSGWQCKKRTEKRRPYFSSLQNPPFHMEVATEISSLIT